MKRNIQLLTIASLLCLTFIFSTAEEFDYCTQKCHNGAVNSMCKNDCENKVCNAVEVTDEFRQIMLDYHNAYRNNVALGKVYRGKLSAAADMQVMEYDKELEMSVKCNIVKIGFNHDECRGSEHFFPQGQNLYQQKTTGKRESIDVLGKKAVEGWFDEVTLIKDGKIYDKFASVPGAGHYTQVIWAKSYIIGCSVCEHEDGEWKVSVLGCNYYNVGNVKTKPIFKKGEPVSECGALHPNNEYMGLCGETKLVSPAHHQLYEDLGKGDDNGEGNDATKSHVFTVNYYYLMIVFICFDHFIFY